jgi:transposase InsO family protein
VLDLASRHLLGWSMNDRHAANLVCGALDAAVATRGRRRMDVTIFHTDRGAEGGFNRSSQHLAVRGCDGHKEASRG